MRRFTLALAFFVGTGSVTYRELRRELPPTVPVVVATRDLAIGIPIGLDDVAVREMPAEMISPFVTFSSTDDVIGRTPTERILSNEIFRTERLAERSAGIGLNALITPGKRAMSITVAPGTIARLAPDNFVDVIAADGSSATTVATQLRVLAVQPDAPAMTIEVTLEEAQQLARALARGTLFVAIRSEGDLARVGPTDCHFGPLWRNPRLSDGAIVAPWEN